MLGAKYSCLINLKCLDVKSIIDGADDLHNKGWKDKSEVKEVLGLEIGCWKLKSEVKEVLRLEIECWKDKSEVKKVLKLEI